MRLWETEERDVRMASDWFIPMPWTKTRGVRVLLESWEPEGGE